MTHMPRKFPRPSEAYLNQEFLASSEARSLRILSEYLEPRSRFERYGIDDTIVFMGSARTPSREQAERELQAAEAQGGDLEHARCRLANARYYEDARELAHRLTRWSMGLSDAERRFVVCTGGGPGIMEAANRGACEADGPNIGLTISIPVEEFDNPYISPDLSFHFHYFFMRKFWFAYLAKAVIVFPGGFGTLDELFELLTLVQTHKIRKHLPIVMFGKDYWSRVVDFDALAEYGTIDPRDIELVHQTDSVDDAYAFLTNALLQHSLPERGAIL